jgi:hypothetical protein
MQRTMPHARLAMMRPASHLGPLERNAEYATAIQSFATTCLLGQSARR